MVPCGIAAGFYATATLGRIVRIAPGSGSTRVSGARDLGKPDTSISAPPTHWSGSDVFPPPSSTRSGRRGGPRSERCLQFVAIAEPSHEHARAGILEPTEPGTYFAGCDPAAGAGARREQSAGGHPRLDEVRPL